MAKQHSRAFTLVELLVVISIIGMLTAILLPAVNQSIRAARQTQCLNNHKEIALAILAHTNAKDRFPGYCFTHPEMPAAQSWVVELLPRLGKGDVSEQWSVIANADRPRIALLLCPEDQQETLSGADLSYVANCGLPGDDTSRYSGIFHDHSNTVAVADRIRVKLDDFRDGTSNTLLLSENYKALRYDNASEHEVGFMWDPDWTASETTLVINQALNENDASTDEDARINAHHVGGANAAFADGSVQFLSENIAAHIYAKLCTPSGGRCTPKQIGVVSEADLNP